MSVQDSSVGKVAVSTTGVKIEAYVACDGKVTFFHGGYFVSVSFEGGSGGDRSAKIKVESASRGPYQVIEERLTDPPPSKLNFPATLADQIIAVGQLERAFSPECAPHTAVREMVENFRVFVASHLLHFVISEHKSA